MNKLLSSEEVFRLRDHRHGELMLQGARLQHVEGCLADQYRLSMLDGPHRAHCETATISYAVHLVEHWNLRVPWKKTQNTVHGSFCGLFPALFTWLRCDYDLILCEQCLLFSSFCREVLHLTCSYKVAVKRVGVEIITDRFGSGHKGLTNYLAPKQPLSSRHPVMCPSGENDKKAVEI